MRRSRRFTLLVTRVGQLIVAFTVATLAVQAQAQLTDRAGKWETTLQIRYSNSEDIQGSTGSRATIDSDSGFGLGFAYNFNDHLSLGADFAWSQPDYQATVTPAAGNVGPAYTVSGTLETFSTHAVVTWNLLARALTPFVSAGVGGTWVDTNIPDGPPVNCVLVGSLVGILLRTVVPDPLGHVFQLQRRSGDTLGLQGNMVPARARRRAVAGRGWGSRDTVDHPLPYRSGVSLLAPIRRIRSVREMS